MMFALETLLNRPRSAFPKLDEGAPVTVTFRRGEIDFDGHFNWIETRRYSLQKEISPGGYDNRQTNIDQEDKGDVPFGMPGSVRSYFRTGLNNAGFPAGAEYNLGELLNSELEKTKETRDKSKPAIEPVTRLQAYVIRFAKQNIGVLRIPSYDPGSRRNMTNELHWIAEVIKRFNNAVDVVIIDQLSNTGGYIEYMSRLASLLAGPHGLDSITVNNRLSETLLAAVAPSPIRDSYTGEKPNWAQTRLNELYYQALVDRFRAGEKWSGPEPMVGAMVDESDPKKGRVIPNDEVTLDKSVLWMNDNRSASCGDMAPALMQAGGRALVYGETSEGLGGPTYRNIDSMPGSELGMRCPFGYCMRVDRLPIENLAVVPDIVRPVQKSDLADGFAAYALHALTAASMLAIGVPVDTIQNEIRGLIERSLVSKEKLPAVNALKEELAEIQKSELLAKTETDLDGAVSAGLIKVYERMFSLIRDAEKQLRPEDLRGVIIPLPSSLLVRDKFLSSLWKKDEIASRLDEMLRLPEWNSNSSMRTFLQELKDALAALHGEIWLQHPCELLLTHPRKSAGS